MEPIYIAAGISFIVGLFGYIIIRFWVLPIGRYRRVKRQFAYGLNALMDMLHTQQTQHAGNSQLKDRQISLRRSASNLTTIFRNELPYWYRLFLESRNEKPLEAADYSMRLSNTRKLEQARKQVGKIKDFLRLK